MKTIIGTIQPVLNGYPDKSTRYYFLTGTKFETLRFDSEAHAQAAPINVPIAIDVEDLPNRNNEYVVSTKRPFFRRIEL